MSGVQELQCGGCEKFGNVGLQREYCEGDAAGSLKPTVTPDAVALECACIVVVPKW